MFSASTLLPSCPFPPIPWMSALLQCRNPLIEIHETYQKQTYRNRFTILSANGPMDLTIPVHKPKGNKSKTSEITISDHNDWKRQHVIAIESAYSSSTYFEFFIDAITQFYNTNFQSLPEMNTVSVQCVSKILKFPLPINYTSIFSPPRALSSHNIDLRYELSPKNSNAFRFASPAYHQVFEGNNSFLPNLSILDIVFNIGLETIEYLQRFPIEKYISTLNNTNQ